MGKQRQKKSGTSKRRARSYGGPASTSSETETEVSGGVMQNMVGGFRRAVGVEKPKKRGLRDHVWTLLLLLVLAAILFWRFGT